MTSNKVSRSGFYAWVKRLESAHRQLLPRFAFMHK